MTPDREPIPPEALPPGWIPSEHCDDRIAYRRSDAAVELLAVRTAADRSHPGLGIERCWELRYRHNVGEVPVEERIGRVSTRRAAIEGLLECMSRIHDLVGDDADPMEIQAVLEGVRLRDVVPDLWSEPAHERSRPNW